MKETKYFELLGKMNIMLGINGQVPSLSPTTNTENSFGRDRLSLPNILLITKDLNVEQLDKDQLCLAHVLLHRFYSSKTNKTLTMEDIVKLHSQIIPLIKHSNFDKLDTQ